MHEVISPVVLRRIKRIMSEKRMTQTDVCASAKRLGRPIGKATLSRILSGKTDVRSRTIEKLAAALDTDPRSLTAESSNPSAIPEPDRWASAAFVPMAHYSDGAFHLDPDGTKVPTTDLPAGKRYVTFILGDYAGMAPEISPGDRLFVDISSKGSVRPGEVVVVPENETLRLGRVVTVTSKRVTLSDSTTKEYIVPESDVLGVVLRVCRENMEPKSVSLHRKQRRRSA